MKTVLTFVLFCALSVCAQDTTSKVNERRNPDGTLRWRIETTLRGKTPILRVHQNFKSGKTTTTRSYMVGGEMVMMESDEDGDGLFETIIVYRPSKSDMEVFTRERDGSVHPVNAHKLAAYKKQQAALSELWDKAFDKDVDAEKFIERVQETKRKIEDAEKEKKDDQK
jgi:hypothetical protein